MDEIHIVMITNPSNSEIYFLLRDIASLLSIQEANAFRISAYQRAAELVKRTEVDLTVLARNNDLKALEALPAIGTRIGRLIIEFVNEGRSLMLERLRGETSHEELLQRIPGIGPELAKRITAQLHIHSLEELELAAYDGRLDRLQGVGPRRLKMIKLMLDQFLNKQAVRRHRERELKATEIHPNVADILTIDQMYREKSIRGELRRIAPRRFNTEGKAWLPIMHQELNDWNFTVLFSNTFLAHQLKRTNDWVIVYYEQDGIEGQVTVVTETRGKLIGKRVIRGYEHECEQYYQARERAPRVLDRMQGIEEQEF